MAADMQAHMVQMETGTSDSVLLPIDSLFLARILSNLPPHPEAKNMGHVRALAVNALTELKSMKLDAALLYGPELEARLKNPITGTQVAELTRLAEITSQATPYVNISRLAPRRSRRMVALHLAQLVSPFLFIPDNDDDFTLRRIGAFISLCGNLAGKVFSAVNTVSLPHGNVDAYPVAPFMPPCMLIAFRLVSMHPLPGCRIACVTKEGTLICCYPDATMEHVDEKEAATKAFHSLFGDLILLEPVQAPGVEWFINRVLSASQANPPFVHLGEGDDENKDMPDDAPLFNHAGKRPAEPLENNKKPAKRIAAAQNEEPPASPEVSSRALVPTTTTVAIRAPSVSTVAAKAPSPPPSTTSARTAADDGIMVGAALAAFQSFRAMFAGQMPTMM